MGAEVVCACQGRPLWSGGSSVCPQEPCLTAEKCDILPGSVGRQPLALFILWDFREGFPEHGCSFCVAPHVCRVHRVVPPQGQCKQRAQVGSDHGPMGEQLVCAADPPWALAALRGHGLPVAP